jgi:hypothetical protein
MVTVASLTKSNLRGLKIPSPDGRWYLINQEDVRGVAQIYVGRTGTTSPVCISDMPRKGGPSPDRMKMQVQWHPSGKWILCAVEREQGDYNPGLIWWSEDAIEGILQCGVWTNMWAVSPDGMKWVKLTSFKSGVPGVADGFTGPALTPDGKTGVWSQAIGEMLTYRPFGRWDLVAADWVERRGIPGWANHRTITPYGMHWNEPGNFAPDGRTVLLTGSYAESDQQGMDQYTFDIVSGNLVNLTNSPTIWDEHGIFSPDGEKILFMSAYPYRDDPAASTIFGMKAEFMLMNRDGSALQQLTHFRDPGAPEYHNGIAAIGHWAKHGRTLQLLTLEFPNYRVWDLALA